MGFIQKSSRSTSNTRATQARVANMLAHMARGSGDPRLSMLAQTARIDAFTKVKKAVQDMIDQLVKEKEDEIKHKDFCEEKIADLAESIVSLKKLQASLKAEITELQVEIKRAGEDREKANSEFQTTVADQRATQKLLAGALNILKGFYDKAALVQKSAGKKQEPAGPPPPPGFKEYKNNAASGGVMGMIQMIIDDAKAMEEDAIKAEEAAQIAYETFTTETNAAIDAATKESITSAENKAKAEAEKSETELARDGVGSEIEALIGENVDLHKSCDYTLKNFDLRQTARQSEMEALKQALSILSGAAFSAFLQQHH